MVRAQFLTDLAKRPEDEYPSAVGRVREGLDETLTVLTLHLSTRLQRSLGTTNAAESLLSRTRHMKRNVKRSTSRPLEGMVEVPVVVQVLVVPSGSCRVGVEGERRVVVQVRVLDAPRSSLPQLHVGSGAAVRSGSGSGEDGRH